MRGDTKSAFKLLDNISSQDSRCWREFNVRGYVHLVEGDELLQDLEGYSMDIVHPGDLGMIQIGERLAQRVKEIRSPP